MESLDIDCVTFAKKWTAIFEVREALLTTSGRMTDYGESTFRRDAVTLADEKPDHAVKLLDLARRAKLPAASYRNLETFVRSAAADGSSASVIGDNTLAEFSSWKKSSSMKEEDSKEQSSKTKDKTKESISKADVAEKSGDGNTTEEKKQQYNMEAINLYKEAKDDVMTGHQVGLF